MRVPRNFFLARCSFCGGWTWVVYPVTTCSACPSLLPENTFQGQIRYMIAYPSFSFTGKLEVRLNEVEWIDEE